jgi:ATP-dependent Clp protease adaptor protein ClpS
MAQAPDNEPVRPAPPGGANQPEPKPPAGGAATAPAKPKRSPKPKRRNLPPWKVLLHNDDVNTFDYVILTIRMLTPLSQQDAELRAQEADKSGVALLLSTHKERAELYVQQFTSRQLSVTMEPAE